jgi:hypothetical protein
MINYTLLDVLPQDIQQDWLAQLNKNISEKAEGHFHVVAARRTKPKTFEELKVIVLVVDENGFPIPNVQVAFSYSTADKYTLSPDFLWTPPSLRKAFVVYTQGGGQIDQVQGSVVNEGEPGGITVYCLEPKYSSDYVSGAGALASHEGLHLTFQLRRKGVIPILERLEKIEKRLSMIE